MSLRSMASRTLRRSSSTTMRSSGTVNVARPSSLRRSDDRDVAPGPPASGAPKLDAWCAARKASRSACATQCSERQTGHSNSDLARRSASPWATCHKAFVHALQTRWRHESSTDDSDKSGSRHTGQSSASTAWTSVDAGATAGGGGSRGEEGAGAVARPRGVRGEEERKPDLID